MKTVPFLFIILIVFTACNSSINITQPTIINKSNLSGVGDTIILEAIEYAEIDNQRVEPDFYKWEIKLNNIIIEPDSISDSLMIWIPKQVGNYIIYLTIGYDNNKSITILKEIEIKLTSHFLQSKIIGSWNGYYVSQYGYQGDNLTINIYDNGHFIGNNSNDWVSAMLWGSDIDVPCAKIVIETIENAKGYGKIYIPFGSYDNDPSAYCCEFLLQDLEFISDYDSLTFKVQDYGCNFNNEFIRHYLKKN